MLLSEPKIMDTFGIREAVDGALLSPLYCLVLSSIGVYKALLSKRVEDRKTPIVETPEDEMEVESSDSLSPSSLEESCSFCWIKVVVVFNRNCNCCLSHVVFQNRSDFLNCRYLD